MNTQTSVMVKKLNNAENEPIPLQWSWRPEMIDDAIILGRGQSSFHELIDQKVVNDTSDYLWYMTK